jgi:hypothetical protein
MLLPDGIRFLKSGSFRITAIFQRRVRGFAAGLAESGTKKYNFGALSAKNNTRSAALCRAALKDSGICADGTFPLSVARPGSGQKFSPLIHAYYITEGIMVT